jgi:protein SCO1/2
MKAELAASYKGALPLQLVFFSVDPLRDTPQQMADYVSLFDGDILGITGGEAAIQEAAKRFGIFSEKIGDGEDYLVDHSSSVYLYDQTGRFKGTISPAEPYEMGLAKLVRLTGAKGQK